MQYVDFLITLQSLSQGKEIKRAQANLKTTQAYDVHCSIMASNDRFKMALMEDGWVAFIFESEILIYPCGCVDNLLTDAHIQSINN